MYLLTINGVRILTHGTKRRFFDKVYKRINKTARLYPEHAKAIRGVAAKILQDELDWEGDKLMYPIGILTFAVEEISK